MFEVLPKFEPDPGLEERTAGGTEGAETLEEDELNG